MDILIDKPPQLKGYALHRVVAQHPQGEHALWADEGAQLRIRPRNTNAPEYEAGTLLAFMTKACVAYQVRHKNIYLPLADWSGRKTWLEKQSVKHGFSVVGVHVKAGMERVQTHDGRSFTIDATEFTGLLRVTDSAAFQRCLVNGLGKVGKAFGLNLLLVQ
jgi:CRISPR-associated protein Cas6/Cse3/CasE subtype I-E